MGLHTAIPASDILGNVTLRDIPKSYRWQLPLSPVSLLNHGSMSCHKEKFPTEPIHGLEAHMVYSLFALLDPLSCKKSQKLLFEKIHHTY